MVQRIKYFAIGFWVDQHLAQWITTILIMVNIGLGTAIFAGGIERFTVPSYNPLVDYTHGQVWVWAVWICGCAFMMATPFRWMNIIGLWFGMLWHIVWMACFAIATIHYNSAGATPMPMYGGVAMIHAALLTARVIDKTGG